MQAVSESLRLINPFGPIPEGTSNFCQRLGHLVRIPGSCIQSAVLAILGIGALLLSTLLLDKNDKILYFGLNNVIHLGRIFTRPLAHFLCVLNPEAKRSLTQHGETYHFSSVAQWCDEKFSCEKWNFKRISKKPIPKLDSPLNKIAAKLLQQIYEQKKSGSFFQKNIAQQFSFALLALIFIVSRVFRIILSVLLIVKALLCLGRNSELNSLAIELAHSLGGLISDVIFCLKMETRFENPQTDPKPLHA